MSNIWLGVRRPEGPSPKVPLQGFFSNSIAVILIGEDLGLGWDPGWPRERIDRIWNNYVAKCWRPDLKEIGLRKR